jgi:hypothetical protein
MLAETWTGVNQTGTVGVFGVPKTARLRRFSSSDLIYYSMYANISSVRLFSSTAAVATMILFRPLSYFEKDYDGVFLQVTNKKNSGSAIDVDSLGGFGFNNLTTSMLLIRVGTGNEFRVSFRDIFLDEWNDTIDPLLTDGAKRDGNPVLTWDLYPKNVSYLNPNKRYLKVHQKLAIELDWWADYEASITYHIYLGLNSSGKLMAKVARWAYWIEGGIKSGGIEDKLKPAVIKGMNTLNEELGKKLASFSAFTFKDLYYLPGNQTTSAPAGVLTGFTTSDVTIVMEG